MPSKILSFICHAPGMMPGSYPSVPTMPSTRSAERKSEAKSAAPTGHFAAIYENDRFVRFKYINNAIS
ncbi:hypothetical protein GCM10011375_23710 [Hymenobacter qilianensis]|uniref:Uncharacterized protein n=2 Tax=Hymenobacter qilianensis TaxID=1385715 RepID=A0ACB5PSH6_9BACT|nr:hypothetical protein [Hymenobacter qilianensis]QNP52468.1 hypothetical protein H9L05_01380 [Hymenobacter qilianensis]GGF67914.1 hypothetical protein GCM10011375_23710 [Hymenobacter qilianensis]